MTWEDQVLASVDLAKEFAVRRRAIGRILEEDIAKDIPVPILMIGQVPEEGCQHAAIRDRHLSVIAGILYDPDVFGDIDKQEGR